MQPTDHARHDMSKAMMVARERDLASQQRPLDQGQFSFANLEIAPEIFLRLPRPKMRIRKLLKTLLCCQIVSLSSCTPFPRWIDNNLANFRDKSLLSSVLSHSILLLLLLPTYVSLHSERQIGAALKAEWCAARRPSSVVLIFPHLKSCHLQ